MAVNNNDLLSLTHIIICFVCAQMLCMSHYYKVIVCRANCMDAEYAILTLLVKSVKIVEKIIHMGRYRDFKIPRFNKNRDFDLLTIILTTLQI